MPLYTTPEGFGGTGEGFAAAVAASVGLGGTEAAEAAPGAEPGLVAESAGCLGATLLAWAPAGRATESAGCLAPVVAVGVAPG